MALEHDDVMMDALAGRVAGDTRIMLEDTLAELNAAVDKRIYRLMSSGETLDVATAMNAWGEKNGYEKIVARLRKKEKIGARASAGVADARKLGN